MTIGITLRLPETRGWRFHPASVQAAWKIAICSDQSSSNGTPVSSASSVELIRIIPGSPALARSHPARFRGNDW